MQASYGSDLKGEGLVILYELELDPCLLQGSSVPGLAKEASMVAKTARRNNDGAGKRRWLYLQE